MDMPKSKVYIQTDDQGRILRCEGGYTTPQDLSGWTCIDEGYGDRYNLCQSHYFDGGLYTLDGVPRYKLTDGAPALRTEEEIETDSAPAESEEPDTEADMLETIIDHEARLSALELVGGGEG